MQKQQSYRIQVDVSSKISPFGRWNIPIYIDGKTEGPYISLMRDPSRLKAPKEAFDSFYPV